MNVTYIVFVRPVIRSCISNINKGKGKGKILRKTGHEGPEGSRSMALLLLQPLR